MNINYVKHYSPSLGRDMEYKTYGDSGHAVLVFPSQNGRFFDYENMGMVNAVAHFIEEGKIRLICVDSIDGETWSNTNGDARWRIEQHERWYHYVVDEVIPGVRRNNETFIVTGCSMGGFHAGNFFFRRPDLFDTLIALSGLYHASYFFGNYVTNSFMATHLSTSSHGCQMTTTIGTSTATAGLYVVLDKADGRMTCWNQHAGLTPYWHRRVCHIGLTTGDMTLTTTGLGGRSR